MQLFRKTICKRDESSQHAIYTIESSHPAPEIQSSYVEKINIPGAEKIFIEIDPRSQMEGETITFYDSEDLLTPKRVSS